MSRTGNPASCSRGSAAVEFALTFPCLIVLLLGSLGYGVVLATLHSVQQLAAEAARASVAGLSSQERDTLARSFVSNNLAAYPFLTPSRIAVSTSDGAAPDYAFSVAVSVDLTNSVIFQFRGLLPMPSSTITRTAVIRRGGF